MHDDLERRDYIVLKFRMVEGDKEVENTAKFLNYCTQDMSRTRK